jgi:hypothetical protein
MKDMLHPIWTRMEMPFCYQKSQKIGYPVLNQPSDQKSQKIGYPVLNQPSDNIFGKNDVIIAYIFNLNPGRNIHPKLRWSESAESLDITPRERESSKRCS